MNYFNTNIVRHIRLFHKCPQKGKDYLGRGYSKKEKSKFTILFWYNNILDYPWPRTS